MQSLPSAITKKFGDCIAFAGSLRAWLGGVDTTFENGFSGFLASVSKRSPNPPSSSNQGKRLKTGDIDKRKSSSFFASVSKRFQCNGSGTFFRVKIWFR